MKKTAIMLAMFFLFLPLCACAHKGDPIESTAPQTEEWIDSPSLEILTLGIGKADCILLRSEGKLVMIDTGTKDSASTVTDAVRSLGKTVDLLIITHYDKDHIGGLEKVLKKADVKEVVLPSYEYEGRTEDVKAALSKANLIPKIVSVEESYTVGGMELRLLPTALTFGKNADEASNESSLGVLVTHGKRQFLFAGDAIGRRLQELISQLPDPGAVDFVKMPHHGVYDGGIADFVKALSPEYAVICCSGSERPDGRVVSLLEDAGCRTYLTLSGTVQAVSDGEKIVVRYLG